MSMARFHLKEYRVNIKVLFSQWKTEEDIAHIHGWNFSQSEGRCADQDDLPEITGQ